jgi:Ca-activated chloride channel homolog
MTRKRDRDAARRPWTESELEQELAAIEPEARLRPPADLLARIREEIPDPLPAVAPANDGGADAGGASSGWWRQHRFAIAAAFVLVAATGLLTVRLGNLASPSRLAAPDAALERPSLAAEADASGREAAGRDRVAPSANDAAAGARGTEADPAAQAVPDREAASRQVAEAPQDANAVLRRELGERRRAIERRTAAPGERDDALTAPELQALGSVAEEIAVTSESPSLDESKLEQDARAHEVELEKIPTARDPRAGTEQLSRREGSTGRSERAVTGTAPPAPPRPAAATAEGTAEANRMIAELRLQKEALEGRLRDAATTSPREAAPETEPAAATAPPAADRPTAPPAPRRVADVRPEPPSLDSRFDAMQFRPAPANPFVDPAEDPLSTFGLDVDTGSYTLARRYLDLDRLPPSESVRVEEHVNFFDYGDPAPSSRDGDFAIRLEAGPSAFAPEGAERLMLRVGVRARDVAAADRKPAALIFLVDVSGSMQRENRLELVKRSLELLIDELRPEDSIGLVVYGTTGRALLEPTRDRAAIRQAIARLVPEGSTNLEDGLQIAYEMASRVEPGRSSRDLIRRIVLCSDGVANVGVTDAEALLRSVADWAVRGVELTTVGFGMGNYNDELMERLADRGDGAYAYVDSLREARRIFVESLTGTLQTVAADARVQVELDPEVVRSYRLLGYANRAIPDQAFRDERVDAGEIGAGHRVSALYELELAPGAARSDVLATVRLRWRSKQSGETEETEHRLRVRDVAPSWAASPASLRLAQVVAGFAERLGRSPHTGATLDRLFREGQDVLGAFPGRLDVAQLVTAIGEARDLEVLAGQR